MNRHYALWCALLAATGGHVGCAKKDTAPVSQAAGQPSSKPKPTDDDARTALREASEGDRRKYAALSFEDFKKSKAVYKESFAGGKYIVNGDTTLVDEKQLRRFYDQSVTLTPPSMTPMGALVVYQLGGLDQVWNQDLKRKLAYCVSKPDFGARHATVVSDMAGATKAWQDVAAVTFVHDATQDGACNESNQNVVFDVRPVDVGGNYLARAFFPNQPRDRRNVLIDETALTLNAGTKPQLDGILRHELGHTLGFRHEHTRPSAGKCFEDSNFGVLTTYDPYSVMHYPQCNGKGDWSLTLTARDKHGAACQYGPATGFKLDGTLVDLPKCKGDESPTAGVRQEKTFAAQTVRKDAFKEHGSYAVVPGSVFEASIGGPGASGDPDLYVRFGNKPSLTAHDCGPYLLGAKESCAIDVPAGVTQAFVGVHGYDVGRYTLRVVHFSPK